ncbi:hypothetical protein AtDm6_0623 [Acetobacter tropicalis]|uniref:Uncharacterized protein n=1 Tax=Acetobacter tropicalis TaxID=104102 RepID=A0A095B9H3_9PROT|nr:hypothetical protein AtDm6_0623 [Acetobacter tropicalis]
MKYRLEPICVFQSLFLHDNKPCVSESRRVLFCALSARGQEQFNPDILRCPYSGPQ